MTKTFTGPVLVVGYARTGRAVARVLRDRNVPVYAIDDAADAAMVRAAADVGVELSGTLLRRDLSAAVARCELVVMSPGIAPDHPIFSVADPMLVISEIELAFRLCSVPIVAITGTNGKTTVTSLATSMLNASGVRACALGNIGTPLIEAVGRDDLDVAVAEVSSFQLAYTRQFRPVVGTWINFAPDHLDWHRDLDAYAKAKAKIWDSQLPEDFAVANAEDPVVLEKAARSPSRLVTFGRDHGDFRLRADRLVGPGDEVIADVSDLRRAFPHDVMNGLAAIATARSAGASASGCKQALQESEGLKHRVELVGEIEGVRYFDDSKATTPSAVVAALSAFSSVVLIAGGRNKGLDLTEIRAFVDDSAGLLLRAVVTIGEAGDELASAFTPGYPVHRAGSMREAVSFAARTVKAGDVVLLSPGCASFDWYPSYVARGEDFAVCVKDLVSSSERSNPEPARGSGASPTEKRSISA